jgi:hypothetical protein
MPYSQAISNQLTIRNGKLLNIPLNLIVKGDLILLKPGQTVYLKCKSIHKNKNSEYEIFEKGKEVYLLHFICGIIITKRN